ncbi:MAG: pro-sigmaK processing inhibitor BofA family protein [Bacilli bacterium]|nr:pro-sigmaK processing inhibitor BofA family protein [Bacilli bacterium]
MINIITKCLRKILISFLIINGFNCICGNILMFIPVNILTILIVALLGIPGIISINLIYFIF